MAGAIDFTTNCIGGSNKSCGVTLLHGLPECCIHHSYEPELDELITGRAGAVRFKGSNLDLCPIIAYYQVEDGHVKTQNIIDRISHWILELLTSLPMRCAPIITTDLNGKVGCKEPNTMPETEGMNGDNLKLPSSPQGEYISEILGTAEQDMVWANTFHPGGTFASYYQDSARSRIDFIGAPRGLQQGMTRCLTLREKGCDLQLCKNTPLNRDHVPDYAAWEYYLRFNDNKESRNLLESILTLTLA